MCRKHMLFVSVALIILILITEIQFSASADIGVKVGYWAKYRDGCLWSSNDPEAIEPSYVKVITNTKWRTVSVEAISGTNVTISVTRHFKNDTQETKTYSANIASGKRDDEFEFQIVPPDLWIGDTIWQTTLSINDTKLEQFAGRTREINYAGVSIPLEGMTIFEYKWDKTTGVLCASVTFDTLFRQGFTTTTWIETEMIETNMWQPETHSEPAAITWWQPLILIIVVSSAFLLIIWKLRPKRRK